MKEEYSDRILCESNILKIDEVFEKQRDEAKILLGSPEKKIVCFVNRSTVMERQQSSVQNNTNFIETLSANISHPRVSSDNKLSAVIMNQADTSQQRLYDMDKRSFNKNAQMNYKSSCAIQADKILKRSKNSYTSEISIKFMLVCILALTLYSCVATASAENNAPKANSDQERADLTTGKSESHQSPVSSSSSSEKSIVASLSSAVATAAAAAAVAAAQNSLSSNDGRSLLTNANNRHQQSQALRSNGLNLAIKLVDTIPEVPYNILHNMKKLDHAAPFYNVPNRLSGGTTKESSQNFLTTALAASGNFGGAADHLATLFRSPLWKRIADGYGEFTSEFRSRFRAPGAAPMKGPTSSTSKLIRDISVPALLMLLASSMPGGDWRPVRTRRKSFVPVDIPAALPSSGALAANLKSNLMYTPEQILPTSKQADPMMSDSSTSNSWVDQTGGVGGNLVDQLQPSKQADTNQIIRSNDFNFQSTALDRMPPNTWITSQVNGSPQSMLVSGNGQDQNQRYFSYQPISAFQQQQQTPQLTKRSDEIVTADGSFSGSSSSSSNSGGLDKSATNPQRSNIFSSLTSNLALSQSKLMNKLFNSNAVKDVSLYRMRSSPDILGIMSPIKRDQLNDKQRYSLLETSGRDSGSPGGANEQQSSSLPSTKSSLLSSMAHAVASMKNFQPSHLESGSSPGLIVDESNLFSRLKLQQLISDKTINQEDKFMRRQPLQTDTNVAEQRDLTKLLPESWREVVKRTMSTVQQQANVQWKSIEGQLTNWVQDKLKTVAASASSPTSSSSGGSNASQAPVANMLASMSSTALNILGLHKNANSSVQSQSVASVSDTNQSSSNKMEKNTSSSGTEPAANSNQRGKIDKDNGSPTQPQPSRGALAGVATALVKSLTTTRSSTATPSLPLLPPPKSSLIASTPNIIENDTSKMQSHPVHDQSASSSVASKYPTLSSSQTEPEKTSAPGNGATALITAPTTVDVHSAND